MEVTAEHAEGQGSGAWQEMIKRFLFHRIGVERCDIAPRNAQFSALVVTHLADAAPSLPDQAAVSASSTTDGTVGQVFF